MGFQVRPNHPEAKAGLPESQCPEGRVGKRRSQKSDPPISGRRSTTAPQLNWITSCGLLIGPK